MGRLLWIVAALLGLVVVAAACNTFGTPNQGDYVISETCATAPCQAGSENILFMRSPKTTTSGAITTMEGNIELRVLGRDGVYHNYSFPTSTIVENQAHPTQSSITVSALSGETSNGSGSWGDAFGVSGLDLSHVSLQASQGTNNAWHVSLEAKPTFAPGSDAEALVPGHAAALLAPTIPFQGSTISTSAVLDALAGHISVNLTDVNLPITVTSDLPMNLVPASIGLTADSVTLTKVSSPDGHFDLTAVADNAAVSVGSTQLSNVNVNLDVTDELTGTVHADGTVASSGTSWNATVDFPFAATFYNGGIQAQIGPNATISAQSPTDSVSFTGTITASLNTSGSGQNHFELSDGTLDWNNVDIQGLHVTVDTGGQAGLQINVHADSAHLLPDLALSNVDIGWTGDTLNVHGTAVLTGSQANGTVTVDGTATVVGTTPTVDLTVSVPEMTFALPDGANATQRNISLKGAQFHLAASGNLTTRTVTLQDASLNLDQGTFGDTTVSGNLAVSGQIALGSNLSVEGWEFHLTADATIGAIQASADIQGSGGTLANPVPPVVAAPIGTSQQMNPAAMATSGVSTPASVTAVLGIVDPGDGLGGTLRATLWLDSNGVLHLDGVGNAHLTLGGQMVIDGTVAIHDNVLTLNAQAQLGTSLQVPVSGTITVDTAHPTAIPAVDLELGEMHISDKLWIDNVHITNSADLTHFTINGTINNEYAAKFIGVTIFDLGDLEVNGSISLASGDITSATAGNISYDLHVTAPNAYNSPRILSVFYVAKSGLDFHVWGDSHAGNLSLDAQAIFGVNAVVISGDADAHVHFTGTVNFDTGAVSIGGNAGAEVFAKALGITAEGSATMNVSLTGNLNSSLLLQGTGTGHASASFIGIPVGGGDINLGGTVSISMPGGTVSGTAYANWSIDVVGGIAGNHDGDWNYNVAGTVANPIVTAHDSSWRDNHYRAINVNGQVMPVKNLCGTYQSKGTLQFNWHNEGTWGDCLQSGYVSGKILVDADHSGSQTGADTPFASPVTVQITDASNGDTLVGQAATAVDGTFTANVVEYSGHTYRVAIQVPTGYKFAPGTAGFATNGTTVASPTSSGQTQNAGTFGIAQTNYGSLTGTVFNDANHNGALDTGEAGIGGTVVTVGGRQAITDGSGHYDMDMLDVDNSVTVSVQVPSGWHVTADPDAAVDGSTTVTLPTSGTTTVGAFGLCQGSGCLSVVAGPVTGSWPSAAAATDPFGAAYRPVAEARSQGMDER